jgi:hypothetical protein
MKVVWERMTLTTPIQVALTEQDHLHWRLTS